MKKNLFLILAAVAAICSCNKNEILPEYSQEGQREARTYVIEGILDDDQDGSKVTLGGEDNAYFGKWEEGDEIVFYQARNDNNYSNPKYRKQLTRTPVPATDLSSDGKTARFTVIPDNPEVEGPDTAKCRAFYNSDAIQGHIYGESELTPSQTQKGLGLANTSLKKYAFIYTSSNANLQSKQSNPASYMKFYHGLSYVKISFKSEKYEGYKIEKIALKSIDGVNSPLAAETVTFNASTTGDKAMVNYSKTGNYDYIALSFEDDVTVSSELQDAWMVALPTYKYSKDVVQTAKKYSVYFQLSKDGVTTYAKVGFKALLTGGRVCHLKVGDILATDETVDYYEVYTAGLDIKIADLNVNKTTYPISTLLAPTEITNYSYFKKGGVVFIDDKPSTSTVDLSGSNANQAIAGDGNANLKNLAVVGRYRNKGTQTELKVVDMRVWGDAAFLNVALTMTAGKGQCLFERQSTCTVASSLRLADCYIDGRAATSAVIRNRSNGNENPPLNYAASFKDIMIDNCVIAIENALFFQNYGKRDGEDYERRFTLNNSLVFRPEAKLNLFVMRTKSNSIDHPEDEDSKLKIKLSSNTFVNMLTGGLVSVSSPAELVSDKNLIYVNGPAEGTKPKWTTPKYHYNYVKDKPSIGTVSNCYASGDNLGSNVDGIEYSSWSWYAENTSNNKSVKSEAPFTSPDYVNGYFPVNRSIVKNGAGADYSTKLYHSWTATEQ